MWKPCPKADSQLADELVEALLRCPWLVRFANALHMETGSTLAQRLDHLGVPQSRISHLEARGFQVEVGSSGNIWRHPAARLPVVRAMTEDTWRVAIAVDSLSEFLAAYPDLETNLNIEGLEGAPLRRCLVHHSTNVECWAVERWESLEWAIDDKTPALRKAAADALKSFRQRKRDQTPEHETQIALFKELKALIEQTHETIGAAWSCALFFRAEREYWHSLTPAAQAQAKRDKKLGVGWSNHDHHTYRCNRVYIHRLVEILELLGLRRRESFHAGPEAGWGAQVLEHPELAIAVFADVDMREDELHTDFANLGLSESTQLGTVGLWCALHGESMFSAGLHHLACLYEFDLERTQLEQAGVKVMQPFADLAYLRQAFTQGAQRSVDPERVKMLLHADQIDSDQAQRFLHEGALGSHLEIIERKQGYRGFHQKSINRIISDTDPRRN